jgi:hypothetical protein
MEKFEHEVVSRLRSTDGTEEVELDCGHRIIEIIPTKDKTKYCAQCITLFRQTLKQKKYPKTFSRSEI